MVSTAATITGITIVILVFLGVIILSNNLRSNRNRSFFFITIFLSLWLTVNQLSNSINDYSQVLLLNKLIFVFSIPIGYSFTLFSLNFPEETNKGKLLIRIMFGVTFFLSLLGFSDAYVKDVIIRTNYSEVVFGDWIGLYLVYMFASLILILSIQVRKYFVSKENDRKNIRLFFLGLGVFMVSLTVTNLIVPYFFNNFSLSSIGPFFLIFFILFIFRAVYTTKTFGAKFLVGRTIYILLISGFAFTFYYVSAIIDLALYGTLFSIQGIIVGIPMSVLFMIAYTNIEKVIKKNITTKFINPGYDPFEVVDSLGKKLALTLDLNEVATSTIDTLKKTIRPDFEGIIILNSNNRNQEEKFAIYGDALKNKDLDLKALPPLKYIWQDNNRESIIYDELTYISSSPFKDLKNWIKPIEKIMERNHIKAIVPLGTREKIIGMIMMGPKEGDSPYTFQDIELINSIANTTGLAFARSRFYEETRELNETLQKRVEKATLSLRKQNMDLELALTRLQSIRQQERDMLDVLGHELRTPITIVRNALAVLKSDFAPDQKVDPDKLGTYIEKALESTRREMALIETLLSATKIEANRVQLNLEKVDIVDAVEDSIEAQAENAKIRGIEIKFEKPQEEVFVYGDRVRIQEIQDNFVSNAVKYTMRGLVEIKLERVEEKGKPLIRIAVRDTGIGIPKEDIPKLGRKFFRARQYIKEGAEGAVVRPGGTGLGLYVSFELIKIMGGRPKVESEVGEGSIFSYTIPEYTDQEPKHIDQTFEREEDLEEKLRKRLIEERKKLIAEEIEIEGTTNLGELEESLMEEPTETDADENFKKLSTANDIIQKINETRKMTDNEASNTGRNESKKKKTDKKPK